VALGNFSENLMQHCDPSHFIAIDLFKLHELPELWGQPTRTLFNGKSHGRYFRERFSHRIRDKTMTVLEGDSSVEIENLPDKSVGVFYVDGYHTYEGACRDLRAIKRKVTDDGWIIMNDYIMRDHNGPYGVIQATNEFMIEEDWEMIFFCLQDQMYCDVVLRRRAAA